MHLYPVALLSLAIFVFDFSRKLREVCMLDMHSIHVDSFDWLDMYLLFAIKSCALAMSLCSTLVK